MLIRSKNAAFVVGLLLAWQAMPARKYQQQQPQFLHEGRQGSSVCYRSLSTPPPDPKGHRQLLRSIIVFGQVFARASTKFVVLAIVHHHERVLLLLLKLSTDIEAAEEYSYNNAEGDWHSQVHFGGGRLGKRCWEDCFNFGGFSTWRWQRLVRREITLCCQRSTQRKNGWLFLRDR